MNERVELEQFWQWRDEVDCDHLLDCFDLALGWFAGQRRFTHDEVCNLAKAANGGKRKWLSKQLNHSIKTA